jgi:hypothetical protein
MDYAANAVLGELEEVRAVITRPENIFIHMAANLDTLTALGKNSCLYVQFFLDCHSHIVSFPFQPKNSTYLSLLNLGVQEGGGGSAFFLYPIPRISKITHKKLRQYEDQNINLVF